MGLLLTITGVALAVPGWILFTACFGVTWVLRDRFPRGSRVALGGFVALLVIDVGVTALFVGIDLAWEVGVQVPLFAYRGTAAAVNLLMAVAIGALIVAATMDRS